LRHNAVPLGFAPSVRALVGAAVVVVASGCGHPATRAECEEIFRHSAEVELREQQIADPEVIRQRVADAWAERGEQLVAGCTGKRITTGALDCDRAARTAAALDECLK
jgi:hypothetical protein